MAKTFTHVYLGSCGIGRLGFRAWFAVERMDRQDGADDGISTTPGDALRKMADRLDDLSWAAALDRGRLPNASPAKRRDLDIAEIVVVDDVDGFSARFSNDDEPREHRSRGSGATPAEALRSFSVELDAAVARQGWRFVR